MSQILVWPHPPVQPNSQVMPGRVCRPDERAFARLGILQERLHCREAGEAGLDTTPIWVRRPQELRRDGTK